MKDIDDGSVNLIYIDPPFGDNKVDKQFGIAWKSTKKHLDWYRQCFGNFIKDKDLKQTAHFLYWLYPRLVKMRDLLAEDGSIYVHIGRNVSHQIRNVCDEVFGRSHYINELTWKRAHAHGDTGQGATHFGRVTEAILLFSKTDTPIWNPQYMGYSDEIIKRDYKYIDEKTGERYRLMPVDGPGGAAKGNPHYSFLGVKGYWRYSKEKMQKLYDAGEIVLSSTGKSLGRKRFLKDAKGTPITDLWDDVNRISPTSLERLGYDTQKPEALIERIIKASSNEGDLVADFFCGSGTTSAVAEKLGRKWIASDLGKFAIHTTRKRMLSVQRQLKSEGKSYRAFEILNLGKYERELFVGMNPNLREEEQRQQLAQKEQAFIELILTAYRAEHVENFSCFHGKKSGRLVAIGPVNLPVTRLFVEEIILECRKKKITKVDLLGFEFEMGLFPNVLDEARSKGIDIAPKNIPAEIFDKRAVERGHVTFHDVAYIEIKPHITLPKKKNELPKVSVELTDFSVFYSQDSIGHAEQELSKKKSGSKIVVDKGQVIKLIKDKGGIIQREQLTKKWTDWIDYWAVDFDFENKREIVRVKNPDTGEVDEQWTGDFIFENEWQSFRTKKDRSLDLISKAHEARPGRRKIAVKVVDIFGNDTMTIANVNIKGGK
jgi:DNA modification methylase